MQLKIGQKKKGETELDICKNREPNMQCMKLFKSLPWKSYTFIAKYANYDIYCTFSQKFCLPHPSGDSSEPSSQSSSLSHCHLAGIHCCLSAHSNSDPLHVLSSVNQNKLKTSNIINVSDSLHIRSTIFWLNVPGATTHGGLSMENIKAHNISTTAWHV